MPERPAGRITFLLTDIENSTRMTAALGSAAYQSVLKQPHDSLVKAAVARHQGAIFNDMGDGYFAAFQHAHHALACAVDIQTRLTRDDLQATDSEARAWHLRLRIGVHTAIEEVLPGADGNYHHAEVNFAARMESLAGASADYRVAAVPPSRLWQGAVHLAGLAEPLRQELRRVGHRVRPAR